MTGLRRLRDVRAGAVTAGLLLAVIAFAQIADRLHEPVFVEPAAFAVAPAGESVPRLAPIRVTFERAPAERAPQKLLQLAPETAGTYTWLSPRTVLFQPDFPGMLRGYTYSVHVAAQPDAGLTRDVTATFTVADALVVQQVIPGRGDTEVPMAAPIIVQFSRSVAPLTTLAAQPTGSVVTFDPPLHGRGEWLNTSIFRFTPSDLLPATTYHLRIAKGLSSAADGVLRDDFTWTFSTIQPGVDSIQPDSNWIYCGPWQQVDVKFNQPMDASAAAGLSVRSAAGGTLVLGRTSWNADRTMLSFNPIERLGVQASYVITVAKGLRGAHGGETTAERTTRFTTIALPSIARTSPMDREANAGRFGVSIQFATPMDPASLEGKVSIDGFSAADLEGRVFANEQYLSVNLAFKPRTRYVVRFAGAVDRYGQPLGRAEFAFTTGALPSSVSLALPGGGAATYAASTEPVLYFQVTNQPTVTFTLYSLTPEEGRLTLYDPVRASSKSFVPSLTVVRTWTASVPGAADTTVLSSTSLSGGGPLPRGYYVVRTDGQFASQFTFAVVDTVIVMKLSSNELVAWALDHDTGKPLSGVPVRATGAGITPDTVVTDADGLASFAVPPVLIGAYVDRSYLLWVDAGGRSGVMSTRWSQSVYPYQFGLSADYFTRQWVGQLYTDRPIYRPGETAELKGIIRADDDARYTVPPVGTTFQVVIGNARGQTVSTQTVTTNEFGSVAARFTLPSDAPLGSYFISLTVKAATPYSIAAYSFLVAEFKSPEFQVGVSANQAAYVNGDTIAARVTASFFFGGALAGMPVQWSALAAPYALQVKGYERYAFADFDYARQSLFTNPLRATGTAKTGPDGIGLFNVPATLQAAEGAQRFTLSATVTDENGQGVAGSTTVTVHPAGLYVGVHPAQYVAGVGRPATVDLVSVDTNGAIVGRQVVRVLVYDRQWITTKVQVPAGGRQYQSQPKDTLRTTLTATTGADGRATVQVSPTNPGTLRIVAEISDPQGRVNHSATYLWVWGAGSASWQTTNDDTFKLVADKERYQVGDTAEILVPAPFSGATALVTVERGKLITRSVRVLPTNSERISIPITDRSVPDIFLSVVLYRGPTAVDPVPRFKVGYVQLSVSTDTRVLTVSATPDRAQAKPGDVVHYAIRVTDRNGTGVRSEVSVSVVDKAVLSLQDERGPDGLHAFWFERGIGVITASSMAISANRWNDVVADMVQGGKGGSGAGSGAPTAARRDFRNSAYWNAQLTTADDGTAGVDVTMPDNLTTWRMQVRAVSGDTMVGEGTNELVSTQPLLLRSALPRFLRVGDTADLRVLVRNATTATTSVRVTLAAAGVTVNGDAARTVTVAPDQSVIVSWPSQALEEGTAAFTFTASGTGGLADSLVVRLPVYLDVTPETVATGGIVTTEGAQEAVYLPPFAITTRGSLDVQIRSALVGSMTGELRSLEPTPLEGAERVASRLIASLAVRRAERTAGGSTVDDRRIASDLAGLIGRQRPDGGWSWCEDARCATDPNVTAWVLLALGEARRDALAYDAGVATRAAGYVIGYVNRATDIAAPADVSQKAFLLAALSSAGANGAAVTPARALFEQQRAQLTSSGRAAVLLALADGGVAADDPQVRALLNDLAASTLPSATGNHWEDGAKRAAFVSDTGSTALGVLALTRVQPGHALLPQTVRWLVIARSAEGWRTSIDRALGILALSSYAVSTGELGGDYSYQVLLDDRSVLAGLVQKGAAAAAAEKDLPLATLKPGTVSRLAFTREYSRPGRLYYTVNLRYVTPAATVEALNRGFGVSHTYSLVEDPSKPVNAVYLGDTVRVTVTVIAPADRSYVVIEDLLPAGLEPVDARLKTVDPALKAKLDADRAQAAQRQAGGYAAPWFGWYYSPWQQADLHDDRAVLSAQRLPMGVYEYVYYARATAPGDFFVAPAHAEETYFPDVFGRSDSSRFTVLP